MAQHDYIIANQSGAAFRADLNNGLAAIVSQNSGAAQPSTTYAYQWWADTTTGLLKIRNAANSAWITVGTLASANLGLVPAGTASIVNADVNASAGIVATKLAFTQAGTGATARTIDSKLKDVVSVKDFGAVGDGTTDDTAAIQAALNAATNAVLTFPTGTYLVYALKVPSGCTVNLGSSIIKKRPAIAGDQTVAAFTGNSTVFLAPGYAPVFYLNGNNITITGGTIDGNRTNDTLDTGSTWGGSFAANANRAGILGSTNAVATCVNVTIQGIRFINMVGVAIDLDMSGDIRVQDCFEQNAKNLFANITGDATTLLTRGRLWFEGNSCSGDRVQNNVPNSFVLDRKDSLIVTRNVLDESLQSGSGGSKTQDSNNTVVSNNVFINTYLKPQSAPSFIGKTYVISGNTFRTSAPLTHSTGIQFGFHTVESLAITGNSISDGFIATERSSYNTIISGNTINVSQSLGAGNQVLIQGGANNGPAGRCLISNNTVNSSGLASHHFYYPPSDIGLTQITGNYVTGCDNLWYFQGNQSANSLVVIANNVFTNIRAMGRINIGSSAIGYCITGNQFLQRDTNTATNYGSANENISFQFSGTPTIDQITVVDNYVDSTWNTNTGYWVLTATNGSQITNLTIASNIFSNYSPATGYSFLSGAATVTISTLRLYGNRCAGELSVPSGATITAQFVSGNTCEFTGGGWRQILNTTRKLFDIVGDLSTTVGGAGGASALPLTPRGYVNVNVSGTIQKIPYYDS